LPPQSAVDIPHLGYATFFDGLQLNEEEQAKVDAFKAAWDRDPDSAFDEFSNTDTALLVKALDHALGPEAMRRLLQEEMDKQVLTTADLRAIQRRSLRLRH
jgi:hypothetical protein